MNVTFTSQFIMSWWLFVCDEHEIHLKTNFPNCSRGLFKIVIFNLAEQYQCRGDMCLLDLATNTIRIKWHSKSECAIYWPGGNTSICSVKPEQKCIWVIYQERYVRCILHIWPSFLYAWIKGQRSKVFFNGLPLGGICPGERVSGAHPVHFLIKNTKKRAWNLTSDVGENDVRKNFPFAAASGTSRNRMKGSSIIHSVCREPNTLQHSTVSCFNPSRGALLRWPAVWID